MRVLVLLAALAAMPALAQSGAGGDPPVSTKVLTAKGDVGKISYTYDVSYPQFDGKTADFSGLNERFAKEAKKRAEEATPCKECGVDREQEWFYEQEFILSRPSRRSLLVALDFGGYSGGAHPNSATECVLVDLTTGRAVEPKVAFAPGDAWLTRLVELVGADLRKQFVEKPGFEEALQPANLANLLREPSHYCWETDKLVLVFNSYVVGPYVSGPYLVEISRSVLRDLLDANGPLGD